MDIQSTHQFLAFMLNNSKCIKRVQQLQIYRYFGNFLPLLESARRNELPDNVKQNIEALLNAESVWQERYRDMKDKGIQLITMNCTQYPKLLKQIDDPPLQLYVRGNIDALNFAQIAIVGSRKSSLAGARHSKEFAVKLCQYGFAITSGLAVGIDTCAHVGALQASGVTIAVLGSGLNTLYPKANLQLAADIVAKGGALVSEFPLQTAPRPANFPLRNRIISGLSIGTLIVEASMRSGSLITARLAAEQGREVFVLPGSIDSVQYKGCHALIRDGALLVENCEHILEHTQSLHSLAHNVNYRDGMPTIPDVGNHLNVQKLNTQKTDVQTTKVKNDKENYPTVQYHDTGSHAENAVEPASIDQIKLDGLLTEQHQQLLDIMGFEWISIDELVAVTGMSCVQVTVLLMELELSRYLSQEGDQYQRLK